MKFLVSCFLVLSIAALLVAASHPANRFKEHKIKHRKNYTSESEELVRLALFTLVDQDIEHHNNNPNKTYEQGHSHFSDWTPEEKESLTGGLAAPPNAAPDQYAREIDERAYPTSLNLATSTKCVGAIKNQGACGSCYAFSAIATLEYSYCMLHNQTYVNLSEEQIVDCDTVEAANFGSQYGGCNGGSFYYVWQYLTAAGGSEPTSVYGAYTAGTTGKGSTCKFSAAGVKAKVSSMSYYSPTTPAGMIAALNTQGVISVALFVTSNFQRYKSGIFSSDPLCPACTSTSCKINHAVVIVGYGAASGIDFWIVRNSWGASWGEAGYIRMKRGINLCNIEHTLAYAIAKI